MFITWLFLVGFVNVAVGFKLAMWLGRGPASYPAAWAALGGVWQRAAGTGNVFAPPPAPDAATEAIAMPKDEAELTSMLEMEAEAEPDIAAFGQSYDDDFDEVAALLDPDTPENWDLNEKFVETSVLRLNVAMFKSGARNTEIDTRLRECRGSVDLQTLQECWSAIKEDCESYLAEQNAAADKLNARIDEMGELRSLGEEIAMTNLEQAAQIETTLSNLAQMNLEADPEAAAVRLISELDLLRVARHRLRDAQETAFLVIARYENRLDKIERQLFIDPLTRLRNRIGLETTLFGWWGEGRHKSRQISAILFDVDGFGAVNKQFGSTVGDKLVYHLGQSIQSAFGKADLVGRYAGERFLAVTLDSGPRAAIKTMETLRQSIAQSVFLKDGCPIRLTLSAGATEVLPGDAYHEVLERAEKALRDAKKRGPNNASTHDGRQINPVESPGMNAKPMEIMI